MLDKDNIRVLYYGRNKLFINTQKDEFIALPSDGETPSEIIMSLNDLKNLNQLSPIIRNGKLTFLDEEKEEIYKELRIRDWENIKTDLDYKEYIMNRSVDGLQSIIDIQDVTEFERIRAILLIAKDYDQLDVSNRVVDIIENRYKELKHGKRISDIRIVKEDVEIPNKKFTKAVDELKTENESLKEQVAQMQKMMEQILAMQMKNTTTTQQDVNSVVDVSEDVEVEDNDTSKTIETPKKKAGRPSTKKQ